MLSSVLCNNTKVPFPQIQGERIYMHRFNQREGLPKSLAQWQPTVDAMLTGVEAKKDIFLMVDQGFVEKGKTLRRPGLHVDGYWMGTDYGHSIRMHGFDRHGHVPDNRHDVVPRHSFGINGNELLILASDVYGCDFYEGEWDEKTIGVGGSLPDWYRSSLCIRKCRESHSYIGDVFTPHMSVPMTGDCYRTVVRLNVQV